MGNALLIINYYLPVFLVLLRFSTQRVELLVEISSVLWIFLLHSGQYDQTTRAHVLRHHGWLRGKIHLKANSSFYSKDQYMTELGGIITFSVMLQSLSIGMVLAVPCGGEPTAPISTEAVASKPA